VLNGSLGNGVYTGGGTWTKLVATTRDPIIAWYCPRRERPAAEQFTVLPPRPQPAEE